VEIKRPTSLRKPVTGGRIILAAVTNTAYCVHRTVNSPMNTFTSQTFMSPILSVIQVIR